MSFQTCSASIRRAFQNQPDYLQNQPGYLRDKAVSTAVAVALGIIVLLAILFANAPYSRGHF